MSDGIWATVILASVSIIGILIAQVLSSRSSKTSSVFQKRAELFQEAYRDNHVVISCLGTFVQGHSNKEPVEKIDKLVNDHTYNFPSSFLLMWSRAKNELSEGELKDINKLRQSLEDSLRYYMEKYFKEVLGIKIEVIKKEGKKP